MPSLQALRCQNHLEREAAALCSRCRTPRCRECVTEHEGQVLCRSCLARPETMPHKRAIVGPRLAQAALLSLSFVSLVLLFVLMGKLLLLIPRDFHEGTVWQSEPDP